MAFLDDPGLVELWHKILAKLSYKVDKAPGKMLSSNDFTNEYKSKLDDLTPSSILPPSNSAGQFLQSGTNGSVGWADVSMKGVTHIGDNSPTSDNYMLWVDTDEEQAASMRADAIKYKTFSIATSAWSGSGPYTYTIQAPGITATCAILNLTLDATSQSYQKA